MRRPRFPFGVAVVGTSLRQEAVRALREGDRVLVVREPDNPADPRALAVRGPDGRRVGYLPAAVAAVVGEDRLEAVVERVLRGQRWGLRVLVTGTATDPAPGAAADGGAGCGVLVRSRSGRVLGRLVRDGGATVTVVGPDGREATYPAGVVVREGTV